MALCANCGAVLTFDTLLYAWFDSNDSCRCQSFSNPLSTEYHLPQQTRHTP